MPIPEALQTVVSRRRFWTDFFWETVANEEDYPDMDWVYVYFPVTTNSKLSLSLGSSMSYFSLEFHANTKPSADDDKRKANESDNEDEDGDDEDWETESASNIPPATTRGIEVAHDDQAHWHPHILRWKELDLICRAAAHHDPSLGPHPGLPLLLLQRFAPICVGDDAAWIAGMLRDAYRRVVGGESCGGFSDVEIRLLIEKMIDARDALFEWHWDDEGKFWWIGQGEEDEMTSARECYSMRCIEHARDQFPSREWEDMFAAAERLVGPPQLPEPDPATSASKAEIAYVPRSKRSIELWLPLRGRTPGLRLSATANAVAVTIDRILKYVDVGSRAEIRGSHSCQGPDGRYVPNSNRLSIELHKDDVDRGLQVIKEALWWATAPADGLRLTDARYNPLPFDLDEDNPRDYQPLGLYFQFGRINPEDDPWRPVIAEMKPSCQDGVKGYQNDESPDVQGQWTVTTTDGGDLEFHFSHHLDRTPDAVSGILALRKPSPMASEVVYDFLAAHDLILLPPGIMVSQVPKGKHWWNAHVVASASEVHEILKGGPCNWWWDRLTDVSRK